MARFGGIDLWMQVNLANLLRSDTPEQHGAEPRPSPPLTGMTVATFTQPGAQPASAFTATIDWGDGTSSAGVVAGGGGSYAVLGSHTYADEGASPVTAALSGPGTS